MRITLNDIENKVEAKNNKIEMLKTAGYIYFIECNAEKIRPCVIEQKELSKFKNISKLLDNSVIFIKNDNGFNKCLEIASLNGDVWYKVIGKSVYNLLDIANEFANTLD